MPPQTSWLFRILFPRQRIATRFLSGKSPWPWAGAAAGVKFYCALPDESFDRGAALGWPAHARQSGHHGRQARMKSGDQYDHRRGSCRCSAHVRTSGGGCLDERGLGMSAMIRNAGGSYQLSASRPSTGVPPRPEQGDLWQMLGPPFGDYPESLRLRWTSAIGSR